MNRICVYAIGKNERKHVDGWYENVKEADHVCVLDTGSTDGTVERLKELGIHVEVKTYDLFRFDEARNDSLKLIPDDCNICVTTDFDERFEPGWAEVLRSRWREGITRAEYSYRYRDSDFEQTMNWIHSKDWSWKYPCHEAMARKGNIWYTPEETLKLQGEVVLRHWPDPMKRRGYYLDLLRIRAKENKDSGSMTYLLREFMYRKLWDELLKEEPKVRKNLKNYTTQDAGACMNYIGDAYAGTGDTKKAVLCYIESIQIYPTERLPYLSLARCLDDPYMSKAVLLKCLRDTKRNARWNWLDTEPIWEWQIEDALAEICYKTGEYSEGVDWGHKAYRVRRTDDIFHHILLNQEML